MAVKTDNTMNAKLAGSRGIKDSPFSDMSAHYAAAVPSSLQQAKTELIHNFERLKAFYLSLTEAQLSEPCTSYWGVTYSRYEWLLETLVHVTHHRGQLHALLVHCLGKHTDVSLFE